MSGDDCILLIASPGDAEAGLVYKALQTRGVDPLWIDTANFPNRLGLVATPGSAHPGWLRSGDRNLDLALVRSVYRRSPAVFELAEGMSAPERRFAMMEAVQGMGGALAALPCRWMNHPARVADASYKIVQLYVAEESGLRTPRTMITNVGSAARGFVSELGGTAIYKPMSPGVLGEQGKVRIVNATLMTSECIDDASIALTAHTFQQWIDKDFDARVTVVGDSCFGVAIHASHEQARIDWRADYDALSYSVVEVPHAVRAGIRSYLDQFGLLFAAFDFSVARDGRWWFLEADPNGLWAWLQERTGLPIATTIAEILMEEST
jgi:ATP-grasp ribosomal peptide maturase